MLSTRTTTRAVTLGDYLIHDTHPAAPGFDNDIATACHYPARSASIINPEGQKLPVTCARCVNELNARDRLRELMDASDEDVDAILARHKIERRKRAKPLGPIRARWTYVRALAEAGIR